MPHQRSNHLLGYPDDARLLIINADDFGMCHSINVAILQALQEGVVASTSLMVPCPWAPEAMRMLRDHPEIPFGVHLTIVDDFTPYRWGPVSSKGEVPSLIDEAGYVYHNSRRDVVLAQAKLDEVEREFRAQIGVVLGAGLKPTHLDWHCLADGGREDIFDLTLALAQEYGLALRVHDRTHAERCQAMRRPVNDHEVMDSYAYDPATKAETFARMLRALPVGLNEWAVHPSLGNEEHRAMEPETWQIRRADYDFVMSSEARELIEEEGIVLLDYRVLQEVWTR